MDTSQRLTLAFGAAVIVAMLLSDLLPSAGIPTIVLAPLAIISAAILGAGVAIAEVVDNWPASRR